MLEIINTEIKKTLKNPKRILSLFDPKLVRHYLTEVKYIDKNGEAWLPDGQMAKRRYRSYAEYLKHQKSKLKYLSLQEYDKRYSEVLSDRLKQLKISLQGRNVLCLAARVGSEVKAFQNNGSFAVGIDLNPGNDNKYVLPGDFHNIQFPDNSTDIIFSNSLDHSFDLDKVLNETRRVLKPGGALIVEAVNGSSEGQTPGLYESTFWSTTVELKERIGGRGFILVSQSNISYPWNGKIFQFNKK